MKYNKIGKSRWEYLKSVADMYEAISQDQTKRVTYLKVKVWNRDQNNNIRYNYVIINQDWF